MTGAEHRPLPVSTSEMVIFLALIAIVVSVAVASYRRSRCLSKYSVPKSLAIAVASGLFWEIWVIASIVNRERLRMEWARYRHDHASDTPDREPQLTA